MHVHVQMRCIDSTPKVRTHLPYGMYAYRLIVPLGTERELAHDNPTLCLTASHDQLVRCKIIGCVWMMEKPGLWMMIRSRRHVVASGYVRNWECILRSP